MKIIEVVDTDNCHVLVNLDAVAAVTIDEGLAVLTLTSGKIIYTMAEFDAVRECLIRHSDGARE